MEPSEASFAYRAMPALIARQAEAVSFIREKLVQYPPSQERIQALIDGFDEDVPNVREATTRDLTAVGDWVKGPFERA